MPFDAMVNLRTASLAERLARLGITPIPMSVLEAHKAEQVRLHPASIFATGKVFSWTAGIGVAFRIAYAFMLPPESILAIIAGSFIFAMLFTAVLFIPTVIYSNWKGLRGPARWMEYFVPSYNDPEMPEPIREVVREVRQWVPNAMMIEGKLIQRKIVLDPYILVQYNGERACLGIWDGTTVIACATMI